MSCAFTSFQDDRVILHRIYDFILTVCFNSDFIFFELQILNLFV